MKIKYKLILMFVSIVIISSIPVSIFILKKQEKANIDMLMKHGVMFSKLLVNNAENILLMNKGDIESSKVDIKEMLNIFSQSQDKEFVLADVILLSGNEKYNGLILSKVFNKKINVEKLLVRNKLDLDDLKNLENLEKENSVKERYVDNYEDLCYEFKTFGSLIGEQPLCFARIFYSKKIVFAEIKKTRIIIYSVVGITVVIFSLIGFFFSRIISKPIAQLTKGVEMIEMGDFNHDLSINSKDELGKLTNTFNHMMKMLKLQIESLVNTNKELENLDKLKDEFLANISHELRSPLNGIIGIGESLTAGIAGKLEDNLLYNISLIINSGKRLSGLVDDLLDFSKLKHYDIDLKNGKVDVFSVVQTVLAILTPLVNKKMVKIKNELLPGVVIILGDENRLQQIFLNLLDNALKFTEKGNIIISYIYKPEDNDFVILSVSDTGIGIEKEKFEQIFKSFEQIDGADSRVFGGSGLGLAITRQLVELHGGEIWVDSELGKGSIFSFSLKYLDKANRLKYDNNFREKEINAIEILPSQSEVLFGNQLDNSTNNKTILVVDDESVNLQVLVNHLRLEGYNIETAMEAITALEKLENGLTPDLILLDVMLPVMSGYEACKIIRKTYSEYELPIIMLTAKNKPKDIVTGIEAGANDYISKPINREVLIARVKSLISMKNSVQEHEKLGLLKRDLQIAHEIQQTLLPKDIPQTEKFTIAVRYKAMYELGGDFYDFQFSNNKLGLFLGDVSGHGIPAALISSMLKITNSIHGEFASFPGTYFENINSTMYNHVSGKFITAVYFYIDFDNYIIYHTNAGHWPILIWRKSENILIKNDSSGMPFGWISDENYETIEEYLKPGDRIILHTDGIIETKNSEDQMFGSEQLCQLIKDNSNSTIEEFVDLVICKSREWASMKKDQDFDDDITLVAIDIN